LECKGAITRMVKYLNSTVEMLIKDNWTVRTNLPQIQSLLIATLIAMESQLKETGNELKSFRKARISMILKKEG
jgi:hypothetical protein